MTLGMEHLQNLELKILQIEPIVISLTSYIN